MLIKHQVPEHLKTRVGQGLAELLNLYAKSNMNLNTLKIKLTN